MARIAPVNLPFSIKTLWFDAIDFELEVGQSVVVETQRGLELGVLAHEVFEAPYEELKKLKSPLRPVLRIATDEDRAQAEKMEELSREAMPVFRELAAETSEEMHPVAVAYMLDGDKAIFYFEAEERIDFRDLVRKLASHFHVRIDMRQIGVRDEARIIGGLAHCGQEVCCKRLGGEFKPVSIRMAKDQDLSLNPQNISGLCGRLMCCLRYEDEVYKDFKALSPKKDAVVETPDGQGRVVNLDVPRESVSVQIEDAKPISVPLSAFTVDPKNRKLARVDDKSWNEAVKAAEEQILDTVALIRMPKFTGQDKLGDAKAVHNPSSSEKRKLQGNESKQGASRSRSRKQTRSGNKDSALSNRTPRRRSIKLKAQGEMEVVEQESKHQTTNKGAASNSNKAKSNRSDRKARNGEGKKANVDEKTSLRPGHKSSGLSHNGSSANNANRSNQGKGQNKAQSGNKNNSQKRPKQGNSQDQGNQGRQEQNKRRRRRRRSNNNPNPSKPTTPKGED